MCHMIPMVDIEVFPVAVENVRFRDRVLAPRVCRPGPISDVEELGSLRGFGGSRKTERLEAESTSKDNTEFGPRGGSAGYDGYGGGLGGY